MKTNSTILKTFTKKLALVTLMAAIGVGAFATLGDGKASDVNPKKKSLLTSKKSYQTGSVSLKSNYSFRGSQVIGSSQGSQYISLNTPVTYQSGHTSYTVPLKKKVILNDKVVFNPNAATRR
ncbi:MAG: hypothetical protein ACHQFX_04710 [Chitinophagales bacterium]